MISLAIISGASVVYSSNAHAYGMQESAVDISDPAKVEGYRGNFEKSFNRLGFNGQITSCRMMVQLKQDTRDISFGAICKIGQGARDLLLCDDTMIGKFTIKAWGFAETLDEVASFTKNNCPGGG